MAGSAAAPELVARIFADHDFERLKADADVLSGSDGRPQVGELLSEVGRGRLRIGRSNDRITGP